ncbi:VOC family protein [Bacillus manliponensis]|uniref:VOC family protein n=1 Tax=Bacillus manliponensis TaxID=574376 RepID=UPI0035113831
MLRLDHFVIHIDNDVEKINKLKKEFDKLNLPFNPQKGKATKGFKVANFWAGEQYLEMLYLKNLDGGGWKSEWVDKYNQGKRGIFGICLFTDSLDEIKEGLMKKGLEIEGPERITFSIHSR